MSILVHFRRNVPEMNFTAVTVRIHLMSSVEIIYSCKIPDKYWIDYFVIYIISLWNLIVFVRIQINVSFFSLLNISCKTDSSSTSFLRILVVKFRTNIGSIIL